METDAQYLASLSAPVRAEVKWVDTSVDFFDGARELTDEDYPKGEL